MSKTKHYAETDSQGIVTHVLLGTEEIITEYKKMSDLAEK